MGRRTRTAKDLWTLGEPEGTPIRAGDINLRTDRSSGSVALILVAGEPGNCSAQDAGVAIGIPVVYARPHEVSPSAEARMPEGALFAT